MMLRIVTTVVTAIVLVSSSIATAATNTPVLYPHDNSWRYAYGYSGIDWPVVYVQRGHVCNIMLEPGEMLSATDANDVLLDDRVRWVSVASRSGGQRLSDGRTVPTTWTIAVEPSHDADDAWLTIHTALGGITWCISFQSRAMTPKASRLSGFTIGTNHRIVTCTRVVKPSAGSDRCRRKPSLRQPDTTSGVILRAVTKHVTATQGQAAAVHTEFRHGIHHRRVGRCHRHGNRVQHLADEC